MTESIVESEIQIKIGEAKSFLGDGTLIVKNGQLSELLSSLQGSLIYQRLIGGLGGGRYRGDGRRKWLARLPESISNKQNQ